MTKQNANPNRYKKALASFIILIIFIIVVVLGKYFCSFSKSIPAAAVIELQNKLTQEQAVIQDLQDQNEIQKQDYAKAASWKPIAIEHLVRMADLTLNTTRDVKTALAFLLAAKKYTNEAEESVINHALNKDIASLQAVTVVDLEELVLKIDMVSQRIDTLSMTPSKAILGPATLVATELQPQPAQLLNQLFTSMVKALKDIVIIRHQTTEPILPPQQATILRLNIQTKLLQAELAALQRQNKLYQACLIQVINLITKYFVCNDAAATSVLHALQELQQANLQPDLPTLNTAPQKS